MRSLTPYLAFKDTTREAMGFYQSVLGGELNLVTYADFPQMPHDPADDGLIMHAQLQTPDGMILMAADTPSTMPYTPPAGMTLSLGGDDAIALTAIWDALSEGATITMALDPAPWGGLFGSLTDRYGTAWYVMVDGASD